MAFLDIEDFFGIIEIVVFPKTFDSCQQFLLEDRIIEVKGTVNFKEEETPKILANRISLLDEDYTSNEDYLSDENHIPDGNNIFNVYSPATKEILDIDGKELLKVKIPTGSDSESGMTKIKNIFKCFPGDCPVMIFVEETGKKFKTTKEFWVQPCAELMEELAIQVGVENIKMSGGKK